MPPKKAATKGRHSHHRDSDLHRIAEAVEHIAEHFHDWVHDQREMTFTPEEVEEMFAAASSSVTMSNALQDKLRKAIAPPPTT